MGFNGTTQLVCKQRSRRGAAAVEFAMVGTLLFGLVLTGMEFSRVNIIRHTIENAAYEGARQGIVPGAINAECVAAAQSYLDSVGIDSSTVVALPAVIDDSVTDVTVTVSVNMNSVNAYVTPMFFAGKTLTSSITLPREVN
jgi:Flp pilus assembly protein TadG